jgi:DNA-binding PadR family transcriptional regulator
VHANSLGTSKSWEDPSDAAFKVIKLICHERYRWRYSGCASMDQIAKDRNLGVPRGLLRFLVLKMLSEKPMAAFEIVEEIQAQTNGRWKPSSGSIYPLMAWMLKKGFTKELPKNPMGFRRYSFTLAGHEFLEKQIKLNQDFMRKMEFLTPMLVGGLPLEPEQEKRAKIREPAQKLLQSFLTITNNLEKLSERNSNKIAEVLRECSEKLWRIARDSNMNNT